MVAYHHNRVIGMLGQCGLVVPRPTEEIKKRGGLGYWVCVPETRLYFITRPFKKIDAKMP